MCNVHMCVPLLCACTCGRAGTVCMCVHVHVFTCGRAGTVCMCVHVHVFTCGRAGTVCMCVHVHVQVLYT